MSNTWIVLGVILIVSALVLIVVAVIILQRSRGPTPPSTLRPNHDRMPQYNGEPTYGWSSGPPVLLPTVDEAAVIRMVEPSTVSVLSEGQDDPYHDLQEQVAQLTAEGYQCDVFYIADTDTMCVVADFKMGGVSFNDYGELINLQEQTVHIYFQCDVDQMQTTGPKVHCEIEQTSGDLLSLDTSRLETSRRSMLEIAKEVKQMALGRASHPRSDARSSSMD